MINTSTIKSAMFGIFGIDDNIPIYKLNNLKTQTTTSKSYKKRQLKLEKLDEKSLLAFLQTYGENALFVNNYRGVIKITDDYAIKYVILNRDDEHKTVTLLITPGLLINPGIFIPISEITVTLCAKTMETKTNHGIQVLNQNRSVAMNLITNSNSVANDVKTEVTNTVAPLINEFRQGISPTFIQEQAKLLLSVMSIINYKLHTQPIEKYADTLYATSDLTVRNNIKPVFIGDKSGVKTNINPYKVIQNTEIKIPKSL